MTEQTHISTLKLRDGETECKHADVFPDWLFMRKTSVFDSISVNAELYLLAWCWRRERRDDRELRGVALMVGGGRKSQDATFTVNGSNSSQACTLQTEQ